MTPSHPDDDPAVGWLLAQLLERGELVKLQRVVVGVGDEVEYRVACGTGWVGAPTLRQALEEIERRL